MTVHLNREIKAYCPDFVPVRQLLKDDGATFIEAKEQVDYYYHLPELGNVDCSNEDLVSGTSCSSAITPG